MIYLWGGLLTWLLTLILVESEVARPLREFILKVWKRPHKWIRIRKNSRDGYEKNGTATSWYECKRCLEPGIWSSFTRSIIPCTDERACQTITGKKLKYLVNCHLCSGVWVGWVVAAFITPPLGIFWGGLLYKSVGHGILEVAALVKRTNAPNSK